jgi:hypothetical protein
MVEEGESERERVGEKIEKDKNVAFVYFDCAASRKSRTSSCTFYPVLIPRESHRRTREKKKDTIMADRIGMNATWDKFKADAEASDDPPAYFGDVYDECEWFSERHNGGDVLHRIYGPAQVRATTAASAKHDWDTFGVMHPGIIEKYWVEGVHFPKGDCHEYQVACVEWVLRHSGRLTKGAVDR